MSETVQPDLAWYRSESEQRRLPTPRCPFASVHRCPRYYQSLSLLGRAGSTAIDGAEDARLLEQWSGSDLWPVTDEQATATLGPEDAASSFWNFCPEVAFDRFGLFASFLAEHADGIDVEVAHKQLAREGAPAADWRWRWASVHPMHYADCPLYAPLAAGARQATPRRRPIGFI